MHDKWIYEYDKGEKDEKAAPRFVLGIKGNNPLVCMGINPSTALPCSLDVTLTKVAHYAMKTGKGYDSWIMLNLYPQRATDFSNVDHAPNETLHQLNLKHICSILSQPNVSDIWAAWGNDISKREFLLNCLEDIVPIASKYNCSWKNAGSLTSKGHPRHPSRMAYSWGLQTFDIRRYLAGKV